MRTGNSRVNDLLPGPYSVTVKAQGFADAAAEVTVVVVLCATWE